MAPPMAMSSGASQLGLGPSTSSTKTRERQAITKPGSASSTLVSTINKMAPFMETAR